MVYTYSTYNSYIYIVLASTTTLARSATSSHDAIYLYEAGRLVIVSIVVIVRSCIVSMISKALNCCLVE